MPHLAHASGALAVLAATALAGCAGGTTQGADRSPATSARGTLAPLTKEPVTISFASYNLGSDDLGGPVIRGLVRSFERAHPNVTVTLRAAEQTEFAATLRRQAAVGDAPDLTQVIYSDLAFAKDSLRAQPLEALVGRDELRAALGGKHPFVPNAVRLGQVGGSTYALPFVFSTPVLYYNAGLLRRAGVDAAPTTWDAAGADAKAIEARTGKEGLGVMCLDLTIQTDWCLQGILRSDGADVLSADGRRLTLDTPQAAAALGTMRSLVASGAASTKGGLDQVDAFARGDLGMMLSTSAVQGTILKNASFAVRAAAMPAFAGRPAAPTNSGGGLAILATDPVKQRAAWELEKWLTSPEAQTRITEGVGYLPSRRGLTQDPRYLRTWAREQDGLAEPNLAQLDRLVPWRAFPGPRYKQIQQTLMDAATQVVFRGADPAATLASAQRRGEELMPGA